MNLRNKKQFLITFEGGQKINDIRYAQQMKPLTDKVLIKDGAFI